MNTIAVYGTLREGEINNIWLEGARKIETTRVSGFIMYSGGAIPVATQGKVEDIIVVELYDVSDDVMIEIDDLEHAYDKIEVTTVSGIKAWMYVVPPKSWFLGVLPRVESGDWKNK